MNNKEKKTHSMKARGMFCKIPVTCIMVNGIPTQRLMITTVALAQVAFVRNGILVLTRTRRDSNNE